MAEKVHNNRGSADEKQIPAEKRQNKDLVKILLVATTDPEDIMGTRGHWNEAIPTGCPKNDGLRNGLGIPFFYGMTSHQRAPQYWIRQGSLSMC